MGYPTVAECKTYTGIGSATDDTLLTDLLANAKAFIEGPEGAGRAFEVSANSNRTFDAISKHLGGPIEGRKLWLDKDLCSINSITNGDGTTISSSQYVTLPRNETPYYAIELKSTATQYWTYSDAPEGCITISGKWGYSTLAPADIKQACLELVAWLYRRRTSSGDDDRSFVTADGVIIQAASVPRHIMATLRSYRRRK